MLTAAWWRRTEETTSFLECPPFDCECGGRVYMCAHKKRTAERNLLLDVYTYYTQTHSLGHVVSLKGYSFTRGSVFDGEELVEHEQVMLHEDGFQLQLSWFFRPIHVRREMQGVPSLLLLPSPVEIDQIRFRS